MEEVTFDVCSVYVSLASYRRANSHKEDILRAKIGSFIFTKIEFARVQRIIALVRANDTFLFDASAIVGESRKKMTKFNAVYVRST